MKISLNYFIYFGYISSFSLGYSMDFLVYAPTVTPRIQYTFNHILSNMLGFSIAITQQLDELNQYMGPKLSYSQNKASNCINITPHKLLFENKIIKQSFAIPNHESLTKQLISSDTEYVSFDLFAATFFLISRFEEYITEGTDIHGRFEVHNSLAHKHRVLNIPLVDIWVGELAKAIEEKFPYVQIAKRKFEFIPTIDIDNAYAYKHKGIGHNVLALANSIRKGRICDFTNRLRFMLGINSYDPYDTYQKIFRVLRLNPNAVWFILGGKRTRYDRNINVTKGAMQLLLKEIANRFEIGVHPSYASNSNASSVGEEISLLTACCKQDILKSRQHFLKLSLPETYRTLVEVGIKEDYTMGYPNAIGFRASTCTPFNFYDLKSEKELSLRVVPFQVMDRALLGAFDPDQAVDTTLKLARTVSEVGGTFVTTWHNESLSGANEWKGWEDVFERIVNGINQIGNT